MAEIAPPPTAPTPAATPPPAPGSPEPKHELTAPLLKMLLEEDLPPEAPKKEPKVEPTPPPAAAAPPAGAPAPGDAPIRGRKRPPEKRPDLPIAPVHREPVVPSPAAAAPPPDEGLEEEEKQAIADAEYAERRFGDRFKGLADRQRKFIKSHIEFIKKHGGDENFDPEDPQYAEEYRAFLAANRPVLSPSEIREIGESRVADRVSEGTRGEIDRMKDEQFRHRETPVVEKVAQDIYARLANEVIPKDIMDDIRARTYDVAKGDYKVELEAVNEVLQAVKADVREIEMISRKNPETGRPLVEVAKDPSNPKYAQHQRLAQLARDTCEEFKNSGSPELRRGGKWFVTKDEYFQIKANRPDQLDNFWTFTNQEIIQQALKKVPQVVAEAIKTKLKKYEDAGFIRKPRAVAAPPAPPPAARGAPAGPRPSPVPPAGAPAGEVKSEGARLADILRGGE